MLEFYSDSVVCISKTAVYHRGKCFQYNSFVRTTLRLGAGGGWSQQTFLGPSGHSLVQNWGGGEGEGGGDAGPFPGSATGYKICICSVILRDFKNFWNYKNFSFTFPKILVAIYGFTNLRIFLTPISITFINPKILGFLAFFYEKKNSWGVKCEKLSFRKS